MGTSSYVDDADEEILEIFIEEVEEVQETLKEF